jgi:hypothetical protein
MPLGIVGRLVGQFILVPYISRVLRKRLVLLRKVAQSKKEWSKYLPEETEAAAAAPAGR